jgi:hypothetical protein
VWSCRHRGSEEPSDVTELAPEVAVDGSGVDVGAGHDATVRPQRRESDHL